MSLGFLHRIDPILGSVAGVHLWWYGLSYALGFLNIWWYLRRSRQRLALTPSQVGEQQVLFDDAHHRPWCPSLWH